MRKYDAYKPTKIEFLDEIPEHWEEKRMRFLGYLYGGLSGKSAIDFNQLTNEDNKYFIPFTNIANNFRIDPETLQTVVIAENENQNTVQKGDLFFLMSSENYDDVGKSAVLLDDLEETYLNSFCKGFRITKEYIVPEFLNYQLHSKQLRHNLLTGANGFTRINLKIDKVIDLLTAIPTPEEQTAIAAYLDRKTAEIDELIADKKRLLELYEEEKTVIINQAVTKGINPDVKMKDSGIEWLGEIPEHWEVKRLKYVLKINSGEGIKSEEIKPDGTYPVYGGNGIVGFTENYNSEDTEIIIGRVGAKCGNVRLVSGSKWISDNALVANLISNMDIQYLSIQMQNMDLNKMANQNAQPLITGTMVKEKEAIFPSISEQQFIVHYIETETARIDAKKSKTEKLIELLTEYRTALISEVVTGKIKVID